MLDAHNAVANSGTFELRHRTFHRMGYGAMQLAGPHVFGPPEDRDGAMVVLREALEGASLPATGPQELIDAVQSNCDNFGIERIEIANLRLMFGKCDAGPTPGDVRPLLEPLIAPKERSRIGALGSAMRCRNRKKPRVR